MTSATAALKLYTGEPTTLTPREQKRLWTLRQAFAEITEPLLIRRGRATGSIAKYHKAIWYWEQATSDPAISLVTGETLDDFVEQLPRDFKLLHQSANQQLLYVEAILRSCGPRVGRRGGAGILDDVPCGERLPEQAPSRRRRRIPEELLAAMYLDGARGMTVPAHPRVPAPAFWRTFLVTGANIGPRRCELWRLPMTADVRQPECPDEEIEATSPHGWFQFETPKVRGRKAHRPLIVPLPPVVRLHLDHLRTLDPRRQRIFPAPSEHPSCWRKWFIRLQTHAGITEPFTFQDLRKTCSMRYRQHAGREVAKFILGQQPRGVNALWYDDLTQDAVTAALTLPQPEAFTLGLP
jgi:hypothetical protein